MEREGGSTTTGHLTAHASCNVAHPPSAWLWPPAYQTSKGEFPNEELGGLLILPDLTQCHSARPVPVLLCAQTWVGRGGEE